MTIQTSPENWPWSTAQAAVCGLDIGLAQDHSALITAGAWQSGARSIIGVKGIKQFPLGMPLDEVADASAELLEGSGRGLSLTPEQQRFCVDPRRTVRLQPRERVGCWSDHKGGRSCRHADADDVIGWRVEVGNSPVDALEARANRMRVGRERRGDVAHRQVGDWEALRDELSSMERTVRASGSVAYSAPSGKHDDLIMALALAVFGLRRIGGAVTRRRARRREPFGVGAWT